MTGWNAAITAPDGVTLEWDGLTPNQINEVVRLLGATVRVRRVESVSRIEQVQRMHDINAERRQFVKPDHDHNIHTMKCQVWCPANPNYEEGHIHLTSLGCDTNCPKWSKS